MASFLDGLTSAVFFVMFAFAAFVSLIAYNAIASDPSGPLAANKASTDQFYTAINNVSLFIVIGMSLGAIGAALLIKAHPMFLGVSVILVFIQFLIIPPFIQAFNTMASSAQYASEASTLGTLITLLQYLPFFTLFASAVAALVGVMRN